METEWVVYYIDLCKIRQTIVTALDIQDVIYQASAMGIGTHQIAAIKQSFIYNVVGS